jgi:hypothetical protein
LAAGVSSPEEEDSGVGEAGGGAEVAAGASPPGYGKRLAADWAGTAAGASPGKGNAFAGDTSAGFAGCSPGYGNLCAAESAAGALEGGAVGDAGSGRLVGSQSLRLAIFFVSFASLGTGQGGSVVSGGGGGVYAAWAAHTLIAPARTHTNRTSRISTGKTITLSLLASHMIGPVSRLVDPLFNFFAIVRKTLPVTSPF